MDPESLPLRDIHLPDPISWWPLAPGWWVLIGVLLIVTPLLVFTWFWLKQHRVKRAVIREFKAIEAQFYVHNDAHVLAQELSKLARRAALAYDPSRATAAITGTQWWHHLARLSDPSIALSSIQSALHQAPYRAYDDIDSNALLHTYRAWIGALRAPSETPQ